MPVFASLDTNVSPDGSAFPGPGNDDASRAIGLYCEAISIAATRGGQDAAVMSGKDFGAMAEPPAEPALVVEEAPAPAAEKKTPKPVVEEKPAPIAEPTPEPAAEEKAPKIGRAHV